MYIHSIHIGACDDFSKKFLMYSPFNESDTYKILGDQAFEIGIDFEKDFFSLENTNVISDKLYDILIELELVGEDDYRKNSKIKTITVYDLINLVEYLLHDYDKRYRLIPLDGEIFVGGEGPLYKEAKDFVNTFDHFELVNYVN